MNIKPIKIKKDYEQSLDRLEIIFDSKKGTEKGDQLEILGILIEKYENQKFPPPWFVAHETKKQNFFKNFDSS